MAASLQLHGFVATCSLWMADVSGLRVNTSIHAWIRVRVNSEVHYVADYTKLPIDSPDGVAWPAGHCLTCDAVLTLQARDAHGQAKMVHKDVKCVKALRVWTLWIPSFSGS